MKTIVGACPLDCPDGCSWVVTVDDDGKAVKLRGNADHPYTRGGLCKKVNPWLTYAADPSRLMQPLRRTGPKGSGSFEPISWDDALAEIAERFHAIIDEHGGEAIWPFYGTGNVGWLQGASGPAGARLWNLLGASQHQVSICSVSGHIGLSYTSAISTTFDPEALHEAGLVLLWGSNTLVTNQHLWPFIENRPIVVIDPVRTRTAARADLHIAPRPGTDAALALGLCRAIVDRGGADEAFLAERTTGWEAFRESLDEWTIERTAAECGLDPSEIEQLVTLILETAPLALKLGQGMQRSSQGGQAARVISCLPAVTGSYAHRAGGLSYSTGSQYRYNSVAATRPDLRPGPVRTLAMTNLGANLHEIDGPPVKALVVYGANPMVSNPQLNLVRSGLEREDLFTVAIDLYPTETTAYADIVLPSTMQHEQNELSDSFAHLYANWNEPAVEPRGECLPHTEIFRRLAKAMGVEEPAVYATDHEIVTALLDTEEWREAGIDLAVLRERGFVRLPNTGGGSGADRDDFNPQFATASNLFEFESERADRDGHGALPRYLPPSEPAVGAGEYALVAIGSDYHVNSVFAGTERVQSVASAPPVVVHADDAERDGLVDGSTVSIHNDRGSFTAELRIGDDARPGVATMSKGWWGQAVNATVKEQDSDMGRGAIYHDNRVSITAITPDAAARS